MFRFPPSARSVGKFFLVLLVLVAAAGVWLAVRPRPPYVAHLVIVSDTDLREPRVTLGGIAQATKPWAGMHGSFLLMVPAMQLYADTTTLSVAYRAPSGPERQFAVELPREGELAFCVLLLRIDAAGDIIAPARSAVGPLQRSCGYGH
jgi:hypothetical protein